MKPGLERVGEVCNVEDTDSANSDNEDENPAG